MTWQLPRFALLVPFVAPLAWACGASSDPGTNAAPPSSHDSGTEAATDASPNDDASRDSSAVGAADAGIPDVLVGRDANALLRPLVPVPGSPPHTYLVRVDESGIYVATDSLPDGGRSLDDARIVRLAPDGQSPPLDVASPHEFIADFAIDDANVYLALDHEIAKVPKAGGPTTILASSAYLGAIALDADNVYYTTYDDVDGVLYRIPKTGGAPFVLATRLFEASTLAVTDAGAFVTEGGRLRFVPLTGGDAKVIAQDVGFFSAREGLAYYINSATRSVIERIDALGGNRAMIAADVGLQAIVTDADDVYYVAAHGIGRAPLKGGGGVQIVSDPGGTVLFESQSLAVDATRVYVTADVLRMFDKADPK